jgi:hypothetical protein
VSTDPVEWHVWWHRGQTVCGLGLVMLAKGKARRPSKQHQKDSENQVRSMRDGAGKNVRGHRSTTRAHWHAIKA